MIKIAAVAVITVLVAVFCKEFKQEYGMYISVARLCTYNAYGSWKVIWDNGANIQIFNIY